MRKEKKNEGQDRGWNMEKARSVFVAYTTQL